MTALGTTALAKNGAQSLGSHLFPVWPGAALAGAALPVACLPGDNLAIHVAVAQATPRTVLVVDTAADPDYGYVGEILAVAAQIRDLAGIMVEGSVRDVVGITRCGLPVVGTGVSVREPTSERGGSVGETVHLAGGAQPVRRGDWVAADEDGAVVLARADTARIVAATIAASEHERTVLDALSNGRSTLDVLNLDPSRVTGWSGAPVAARAVGRP
ncbi:RraA family protein [Spiractinospora alimapuensis]|nr:RraA family protein [Spiractinospora alimapuensis]